MFLKKCFILLALLISFCCYGRPLSEVLYDEVCGPSFALLEILDVYGIHHDGSWEDIVKGTQKQWLRKEGKERWDVESRSERDYYALFSKINMTETKMAEASWYNYAVILGSTVQKVRARLFFLKKEWERGVRFQSIVFLTGDRPLNKDIENEKELIDPASSPFPFRKDWVFQGTLPRNETEMMRMVFDQLDMPFDLRHTELIIVDTPQRNGKRPNTKDTFCKWLDIQPIPGKALIFSDQPFLGRGDTIAREMLPDFEVETVGFGFSHEDYIKEKKATPILLDELARWIYSEQLLKAVAKHHDREKPFVCCDPFYTTFVKPFIVVFSRKTSSINSAKIPARFQT